MKFPTFLLNLTFIYLFGYSFAGKMKNINKRLDGGFQHNEVIETIEIHGDGGHGHGHSSGGGLSKGFASGSGLRSIAQGSANQAHSAVANQHAAAVQASYVAKNTLAQAASQAAATAHAALAGKEVLLQGLEQQAQEAQHSLEGEIAQLQLAKQAVSAAKQAAQQAAAHVSILSSALNSAQGVAEHSELAVNEATADFASQSGMVGKAKERLQAIQAKLGSARIEYEATRDAAEKASSSAHEAQTNAAAAAAHATVKLHENAVKHSSGQTQIVDFTAGAGDIHGGGGGHGHY